VTVKIVKRQVGDVAVISLSGALDSDSAPEVQYRLSQLQPEYECLVIDFAKVTCVSSASLRMLVLIYRQARAAGHTVAVVGLTPEVSNVLDATGFLDFFIVAETVADGVAMVRERIEGRLADDHVVASA
jgi:anti-sigma B factor antagonist